MTCTHTFCHQNVRLNSPESLSYDEPSGILVFLAPQCAVVVLDVQQLYHFAFYQYFNQIYLHFRVGIECSLA